MQTISEYLKEHHRYYRDPTPTPNVAVYRVREQKSCGFITPHRISPEEVIVLPPIRRVAAVLCLLTP